MNLTVERARQVLLAAVGPVDEATPAALLDRLRMVQVDPIDRIGTNADLVAFARTRDAARGAMAATPGFEHYAKEWCLLPPEAFPAYRDQARLTPTWRHTRRMLELTDDVLDAVHAEVEARGPLTPGDLGDHGAFAPRQGAWAGSRKVGTLALKVLALRCRLVVVGRRRGARLYDTPARALPEQADAPAGPFLPWAVTERVRASGLLALGSGPWWSMIGEARKDGTVAALVADGRLREVTIDGGRRRYLLEPRALDPVLELDDRMRLLGPLDPLIWNRALVEQLFDFAYVWEVYKPAAQRVYGYYVVPLLHRGRFVGRLEGRVVDGRLEVERVWREDPAFDDDALARALADHAARLGVAW